ncbi:MAG: hypothetical protein Q8L26_05460 [Candidatus Omnitrophota bacterium]|nr:hypothetical protein [Candidatus Omnitrophota bacterium]
MMKAALRTDKIVRVIDILLLALIVYFANIKTNIFAEEQKEEKKREEKAEVIGVDKVLRDPFVSLLGDDRLKKPDKEIEIAMFPMALRGLMVREGKAVAIINEEIVTEGQIWHNFKVEDIDNTGVTLSYEGKTFRLIMKE